MFTGLIQAVGRTRRFEHGAAGARLEVDVPEEWRLTAGESVAVDGCCLTALPEGLPSLVADLSPETLERTCLGDRLSGDPVNLERSLTLSDRLGGHLVQGHVDAVVDVISVSADGGGGARHRYRCAAGDAPLLVPKGSVAVDGVSLTVASMGPDWFEVALVPHTLEATALGRQRVGSRANVEHDLVGRYLLRAAALSGRLELDAPTRRKLGLD